MRTRGGVEALGARGEDSAVEGAELEGVGVLDRRARQAQEDGRHDWSRRGRVHVFFKDLGLFLETLGLENVERYLIRK